MDMDERTAARDLIRRVLQGEAAATQDFIEILAPIFTEQAGRLLGRYRHLGRGYDTMQRDDLVQEAFVAFLDDPRALLRVWDPERGSLARFLSAFARHKIISCLRRRRVWSERPTAPETLSARLGSECLEPELAARQQLAFVEAYIQSELSPREQELLRRIYIEQQSTEEICSQTQLSVDAFYQAKSRLRKKLEALREQIDMAPRPGVQLTPIEA